MVLLVDELERDRKAGLVVEAAPGLLLENAYLVAGRGYDIGQAVTVHVADAGLGLVEEQLDFAFDRHEACRLDDVIVGAPTDLQARKSIAIG